MYFRFFSVASRFANWLVSENALALFRSHFWPALISLDFTIANDERARGRAKDRWNVNHITAASPHNFSYNDKWAGERIIFISLYLIISFEFRAQTFAMCLFFPLFLSLCCVCDDRLRLLTYSFLSFSFFSLSRRMVSSSFVCWYRCCCVSLRECFPWNCSVIKEPLENGLNFSSILRSHFDTQFGPYAGASG